MSENVDDVQQQGERSAAQEPVPQQNGEAWMRDELKRARDEAARYRTERNRLRDEQDAFLASFEGAKGLADVGQVVAGLRSQLDAREVEDQRRALVAKVAKEKGVPEAGIGFLTAPDEEGLAAQAEQLLQLRGGGPGVWAGASGGVQPAGRVFDAASAAREARRGGGFLR